ncbi:(2Fe-2S)-binding protein [Candidatus Woesearchaeota archaeon]|nr:MAG: (2Fe-2S)-binding protein [Candidatus Woesearchaeota archaeon]
MKKAGNLQESQKSMGKETETKQKNTITRASIDHARARDARSKEGVTITLNGASAFAPKGTSIIPAAKEVGVLFGCHQGACGVCKVQVVSGGELLSPKEASERRMTHKKEERLACRCVVQGRAGEVVLKNVER